MLFRKALLISAVFLGLAACQDQDSQPTAARSPTGLSHWSHGDTLQPPDSVPPPDTLPPPPDTLPPPPDTLPPPPDTIPPDTIPSPGGSVARVFVTPHLSHVARGDSLELFARLFNRRGRPLSGRPVTWRVTDSSVVRITGAFGQFVELRAVRRGRVRVSATSEGKTGSAVVVVR